MVQLLIPFSGFLIHFLLFFLERFDNTEKTNHRPDLLFNDGFRRKQLLTIFSKGGLLNINY